MSVFIRKTLILMPVALSLCIAAGSVTGKLPTAFEANHGQVAGEVKFIARAENYLLLLGSTEAVFRLESDAVRMRFDGGNPAARLEPEEKLTGTVNYLVGNDPQRWHTGIPEYARVRYRNIYPGVDLLFYGREGRIEYDFIVAPGADPNAIRLCFEDAERVRLGKDGVLALGTRGGEVRHLKPRIYQTTSSGDREIAGGWSLAGKRSAVFRVGGYDPARPLVIDPAAQVTLGTYMGGAAEDYAYGVATDTQGYIYVAGHTWSLDMPAGSATPQAGRRANAEVYVAKFNPAGTSRIFLTIFGGSANDGALDLAVDSLGYASVAGSTLSTNFPVSDYAFQKTKGTGTTGFLSRLNPTGTTFDYSTYLGGTGDTWATGVAVNPADDVFVTGYTGAQNFPVLSAAQAKHGGSFDAFVVKFTPGAGVLAAGMQWEAAGEAGGKGSITFPMGAVYSTLLGGSGDDRGNRIAVGPQGTVYVTGQTSGGSFPTRSALQNTAGGGVDAFAAKLAANGSLVWATYIGGSGDDYGFAVATDSAGNAYVGGKTNSPNYPLLKPLQNKLSAQTDIFVSGIKSDGSALLFSTYYGGNGDEEARGMGLDSAGNIFVAGRTGSSNFPIVNALQPLYRSMFDAFLFKLNADGSQVMYSTYLGGSGADEAMAMAVSSAGEVVLAGDTQSNNFAATPGTFRTAFAGGPTDAFISKISPQTGDAPRLVLGGVVNAANYAYTGVSPGEIVTLFGFNMGPAALVGLKLTAAGLVDNTLAETRVLFDGVAAPLIYTSSGQVSAVAPYGIFGKQVTLVEVEYKGQRSGFSVLPVALTSPGLFTLDASGKGPGATLNQDYSVNSASNPAEKGGVVIFYGTGEGQTDPPGVDGRVNLEVLPKPTASVGCSIGGQQADVLYAGAAPYMVSGVIQINVKIPAGAPSGAAVPVTIGMGTNTTQPGVTVAIK